MVRLLGPGVSPTALNVKHIFPWRLSGPGVHDRLHCLVSATSGDCVTPEPYECTLEYHLAAESEFIVTWSRYVKAQRVQWRLNERVFMFWADNEVGRAGVEVRGSV